MVLNIHRIIKTKKELKEIYLNLIIQSFGISLIGVFVPIYLLTIGFSLSQTLLYLLVNLGVFAFFSLFAARIASRIGLKHAIILRIPLLMLFLFLLTILGRLDPMFLISIAVLDGVTSALYWVPLNSEFVSNSDKIHEGEEVSHLIAFPKLATIISPLIGAVILTALGFDMLFILVMVILVISILPLFLTKEYKASFTFNFNNLRLFNSPMNSLTYFLWGFLWIVETYIWFIYIFMKFDSFIIVGFSSTLAGIGITILTFVMGKLSDRKDRNKLIKIGSLAYAVVWVFRLFATTLNDIVLLSFLGGIFLTFITIPLFSLFCDFARGRHVLAGAVFWEFWIGAGRITLLFILVMMSSRLEISFILAFLASLAFLLPQNRNS